LNVSEWLPLATGAGTLCAAVVTGFAAAALKHRWDVEDESRRFRREAARQQFLDASTAWDRYQTDRREHAALCQSWSVSVLRSRAARNVDSSELPHLGGTEIVAAGMRVSHAAEILVTNALSSQALELVRADCAEVIAHGFRVINATFDGGPWFPLSEPTELAERMRSDLIGLRGAEKPVVLSDDGDR
jgi:hypothetical protein